MVSFDSILYLSIGVDKPQGEKICIFELKFQANRLIAQLTDFCPGCPTDNVAQAISDDLGTVRLNFNTNPTRRRGGIIDR